MTTQVLPTQHTLQGWELLPHLSCGSLSSSASPFLWPPFFSWGAPGATSIFSGPWKNKFSNSVMKPLTKLCLGKMRTCLRQNENLLRHWRKKKSWRGIPVLSLSSSSDLEVRIFCSNNLLHKTYSCHCGWVYERSNPPKKRGKTVLRNCFLNTIDKAFYRW